MRMTRLALHLLVVLAASCGSEPPEGFTLAVQLQGVQLSAVDDVRLILTPQTVGGAMPRFTAPEMMSYEDGGVALSVDDDGQLVIRITGEYFRANAVPMGPGDLDPRLSLEFWSDDEIARAMTPQIRGVVTADGFDAAAGAAYLPTWPLTLGEQFTLTIPCTAGRETECRPTAP
jgi:hypothetical protein